MVSYWKTQWFYVFLSIVYATLAIANSVRGDYFMSLCWTISTIVMFILSLIGHLAERIKLLEKKAEKYDALCEEVQALYEANRIDREYMHCLEMRLDQLKYDMENR
jgi:hypothetical protein